MARDDPNSADFFVGSATVLGFESYRIADRGTWFINALCKAIREHAFNDSKHFSDICVKVNRVSHTMDGLID